jgi:hypothetical protein
MRLANEKSLELNLTHQMLLSHRTSYAVGVTQQAERFSGVDSGLRFPYRAVLFQYKASIPEKGRDGSEAWFKINNNQPHYDQHFNLYRLATGLRGGSQCVFYAFPIVIEDGYFQIRAGDLIPLTVFVKVTSIQRFPIGRSHKVHVFASGDFVASSEESRGKGMVGKEFLEKIKNGEIGREIRQDKDALAGFVEEVREVSLSVKMNRRQMKVALFHPTSPFVHTFRLSPRRND